MWINLLYKSILGSALVLCLGVSKLQAQTIQDIDGNVYKTVTIGTQIWLAENLKTTKYNDGTSIPLVPDKSWAVLTTPAYCWYDNDSASYKSTYGALYNWHAVNTGKLCPREWHVPAKNDWEILSAYLGGDKISGGKLKESGPSHWLNPNLSGTNESGFSALPGGTRYGKGKFGSIGNSGYWWSANEQNKPYGWCCYISYNNSSLFSHVNYMRNGFSVRCLKD